MRFVPVDPPREFPVSGGRVTMRDTGRVALEPQEQVTFTTPAGGEYDVARTAWGFYATPSVDARLAGFGLRAALASNAIGRHFVVLVERGCEDAFDAYLGQEEMRVVAWLDDPATLARITEALA